MVSYGIVKDKHGMGDTGKIHVFKLLTLDFRLLRPKKFVIEGVVVGVSGKLVFLEAIQPPIFFSSQSTMAKEDIYQKSSRWLHFYSRDIALKILKNPSIF